MSEPALDHAEETSLHQLVEGQTLVLAKLDQATEMLAEILELVSPAPPQEENSLHDLLARMVEVLDRQGVMLGNLSATLSRIESVLIPGTGA